MRAWEPMEISRQTDYALRTIEFLSHVPEGELVQTRIIARQQNIPAKYLPTIVRTLARAGLIKTMRGNHGGIRLSRPPDEITLREVVEAIDGPVMLNRFLVNPNDSENSNSSLCTLYDFWEHVTDELKQQLDSVRISDLVDG